MKINTHFYAQSSNISSEFFFSIFDKISIKQQSDNNF